MHCRQPEPLSSRAHLRPKHTGCLLSPAPSATTQSELEPGPMPGGRGWGLELCSYGQL